MNLNNDLKFARIVWISAIFLLLLMAFLAGFEYAATKDPTWLLPLTVAVFFLVVNLVARYRLLHM